MESGSIPNRALQLGCRTESTPWLRSIIHSIKIGVRITSSNGSSNSNSTSDINDTANVKKERKKEMKKKISPIKLLFVKMSSQNNWKIMRYFYHMYTLHVYMYRFKLCNLSSYTLEQPNKLLFSFAKWTLQLQLLLFSGLLPLCVCLLLFSICFSALRLQAISCSEFLFLLFLSHCVFCFNSLSKYSCKCVFECS